MTVLTHVKYRRALLAGSLALAFLLHPCLGMLLAEPPPQPPKTPNILFFIMDDVGIDQMRSFGYGGLTPPRTPNIDAIARAGVRFRNTWAMPECSPSRAMFFEGRYPFRTNVFNAILAQDLANSQVSPYEITIPKVLKQQGYTSALFGKAHLSGSDLNPNNNPLGDGVIHALGWDYFAGWLDGAPFPIDTTAGGVGAPVCVGGSNPGTACPNGNECLGGGRCSPGPYLCGFVPNTDVPHGADTGACYFVDHACSVINRDSAHPTPGRTCLEQGGIFVPTDQGCQASPPSGLKFDSPNAYYVSAGPTSHLVINREDGSVEQVPVRGYRTILESDLAIDWMQHRPAHTPWMATVSYSAAHVPYQQPPTALLPPRSVDTNGFNCTDEGQQRVLSNQMIEALDAELGRVMVEVGLATRTPHGTLDYRPETTNTMVIIIGDNGTFAPGVKAPFDPNHSKGTVYQTGVWVPLIVAGPLVNAPDRDVQHMVNLADLFELFGEIADVNVHKVVPKSHVLDAVSMLPYLTNPNQNSIRNTNFTQTADNIRAPDVMIPPCVITAVNTCVQLFPQQQLCAAEGGVWYGPGGAAGAQGLDSCCAVNQYLAQLPQPPSPATILPVSQLAIRNDHFKLVQLQQPNCDTGQNDTITEFYEINERPVIPKIDRPDGRFTNNLLTTQPNLTPIQLQNFNALTAQLQKLLDSQPPPCPGDGNLDLLVNAEDLDNWQFFSTHNNGQSSWYDFNHDGVTDELDQKIILDNFGTKCPKKN
jgi:arylsulfatase A-like enzyme